MKNLLFAILFSLLLVGCTKTSNESAISLEGTYKGVFKCKGKEANINLKFYDSSFSGYSELSSDFPVVRYGKYILNLDTESITFINESVFDSQHPDSYVLNGRWEYKVNDGVLVLSNAKKQEYILQKK
ncbi:hypothetical protein [Wenyingzhuangia sp. IMCC45574]